MRIVSWNTNGLRGTLKAGMWQSFLDATHPDVICLQETKSESSQLPADFPGVDWHAFYSSSKTKKGYSGVAIITRTEPINVVVGIGIKKFDDEGRTITAFFAPHKKGALPLVVVNCYFPNGGGGPHRLEYKLEFYAAFLKYVEKLKKSYRVVFTGDVNTAHTEIDLARPKENVMNTGFLPIERAWIDSVVKHGWSDVFRALNPDARDVYTYWDQKTFARSRNVGWRIDYFFAEEKVAKLVEGTKVHDDVLGSDHCPISLDLNY